MRSWRCSGCIRPARSSRLIPCSALHSTSAALPSPPTTAALAAAAWGRPAAAAGPAAVTAAALLALSVVTSLALLVPINNRSATWTADVHPADWRQQQQRWDRLHYARVALLIAAAFVLTLVAATLA